jgi:gas vesicle protein
MKTALFTVNECKSLVNELSNLTLDNALKAKAVATFKQLKDYCFDLLLIIADTENDCEQTLSDEREQIKSVIQVCNNASLRSLKS